MALCVSKYSLCGIRRTWNPRNICSIERSITLKGNRPRYPSVVNSRISCSSSQSADFTESVSEIKTSDKDEDNKTQENVQLVRIQDPQNTEPLTVWRKIYNWFKTDKTRIRNLGIGAILSYGFVSNVNSGICFTVAWLTHVKRTGIMPFAPGQWKGFLAIYAGLWALYSVLRPLRIALAIALTPLVNRMMDYLVEKLGVQRKQAFFLLLIALAVFTVSSFGMAVWILGGVPTKPPLATG